MIKSLFITGATGDVLIERHWRGVTPRSVCDYFWDEVNRCHQHLDVSPVLHISNYYLMSIYRADIYLIASITNDVSPLLIFEFLHRVVDIFIDYFGASDERTIKDNFSVVYQLLEEMLDDGNPLTTEPNALKAMIKPPSVIGRLQAVATGKSSVSDVLPDGTISSMPWRKSGVKYAQNDIYLDIIEEVDAIIDRNGQVVSSEVTGAIMANSRLSGIPDLCLTFVDPQLISDCSFHPCVRYNRFERDRVVSFVPPDGLFELMRYRVNTKTNVSAPIFITPSVIMSDKHNAGHGRIQVQVGHKQSSSLVAPKSKTALLVENVSLLISFPRCVKTANLSTTLGSVLYDEAAKTAEWSIGRLPANPAKIHLLNGTMVIQGCLEELSPIQVSWKIPVASISGIQVSALQLSNERYRPYKGVRTITKSGRYQVRTT
mmetsp:Transcript_4834/g.14340  ORF Transcript_4834/g.14340 Transcript_4834/m.14340 type:complete len:430 (+) Transcript_4834:1032-2321(+)|eukprot:CAMPEP_0119259832 /NCGR_PEP_ID=MMETSP1329-20130426/486_1 /TAXON_ID=114041 /ORGANISM="Genus nov. species nov., Strain RCC1024" /LENGTH=429 /DNA_ID=CAMNT_0007259235 /DNA_START=253 /DNA_END=1542 /DNA_ORIENTATION=+